MTVDRDPNPNPNKPANPEDWAVVGEVVGVFGIHGELKVRPQSDFSGRFAVGGVLYLGPRHERRVITASRPQGARGTQVVLALEGCVSANDAERLRGQTLSVPASELGTLAAGQFYQHDIIGLRVERLNGQFLGVVSDILPSGSSDLYIVRDPATGQERMLPAVKEFVHEIDLAAGVIRVTPIPGLFDDDADEARDE